MSVARSSATAPRQNGRFAKTKMCRFEALGTCARGSECSFAHSAADLTALPDLARTKICVAYATTGECCDPVCTYAHNASELRSAADGSLLPRPNREVAWLRGPANRKAAWLRRASAASVHGEGESASRPFLVGRSREAAGLTEGPFAIRCPLRVEPFASAQVLGEVAAYTPAAAAASRAVDWLAWSAFSTQGKKDQDDSWSSSVGDLSTCDPEDRQAELWREDEPVRLVRSADGALRMQGAGHSFGVPTSL